MLVQCQSLTGQKTN